MDNNDKNLRIKQLRDVAINKLTAEDLSIPEVFNMAYRKIYSQGEIRHLLQNSPIHFLADVIEDMVSSDLVSIDDIPHIFLEEYHIAMLYIEKDYCHMVSLPEHYRDDEDFIYEASFHDGSILSYASDRVKNIQKICESCLKNSFKSFQFFPEIFKTRDNCILALKHNSPSFSTIFNNWQYVPYPLRLDEEFIKEVGVFCPKIYQHLDIDIKNKYEITKYFIEKHSDNIQYLPEEHKNDLELLKPIIEKYPNLLRFVGDILKNDPDFITPIIKKSPYSIYDCGDSIKDNIEIAKLICNLRVHEPAISFFNEEIKSDITVALISLLRMPESMNYISKKLSSDPDFISLYIEQVDFNHVALHYLPNELKNNRELMIKAYDNDVGSISYFGSELRNDHLFLNHVFSDHNQEKMVHKNTLLSNLKAFDLVTGDEDILLNFLQNSKLDSRNIYTKSEILRQIVDNNFKEKLNAQPDLYHYLKTDRLMKKLEQDLDKKELTIKKIKV